MYNKHKEARREKRRKKDKRKRKQKVREYARMLELTSIKHSEYNQAQAWFSVPVEIRRMIVQDLSFDDLYNLVCTARDMLYGCEELLDRARITKAAKKQAAMHQRARLAYIGGHYIRDAPNYERLPFMMQRRDGTTKLVSW